MKVVLAGKYPDRIYETLRKLLPQDMLELVEASAREACDSMTDAEIMILRIFKAPAEVIERNRNLNMILRREAEFDSVDIEAAGEHGVIVPNTPGANAGAVFGADVRSHQLAGILWNGCGYGRYEQACRRVHAPLHPHRRAARAGGYRDSELLVHD